MVSAGQRNSSNLDPSQVSALTNILVIVGFAVFAWTVKYVINSLGEEDGWS